MKILLTAISIDLPNQLDSRGQTSTDHRWNTLLEIIFARFTDWHDLRSARIHPSL